MKTTDGIYSWIRFLLGSFLIGIAICFFDKANLGADAMTILCIGLVKKCAISLAIANLIINCVQIISSLILYPKAIGPSVIVAMIACTLGIQFGYLIELGILDNSWILLALGITLNALGLALTQLQQLGYTAYDSIIQSIIHRFHFDYVHVRWFLEIIYCILGLLLGSKIGIGTVLIVLICPKETVFFSKKFRQFDFLHPNFAQN